MVTVFPVPGFGDQSTGRTLAYLKFDGEPEVDAWRAIRRIDAARYQAGADERNKVATRFRNWMAWLKRDEFTTAGRTILNSRWATCFDGTINDNTADCMAF